MKTHWKKFTNPDFLGAYAIEPGEDLILTIKSVGQERFTGQGGKQDEGLVIHFEEAKPMICNATNAKQITKVLGTPYIEEWTGNRIALGVQTVSAFGDMVEALRVQPYKPKEEYICDECGKPIRAAYGKSPKAMMNYTLDKYDRPLCAECAKIEAEKVITDEE